ncbi:MAG: hypothetical protein AAF629_10430 [Chloroflexota bacterium]
MTDETITDIQNPVETATVCYRHPQTETSLRCAKCSRYICPKCANRTPVGYICPECVREQENRFFTGGLGDYGIAAIIAFPLSLLTAFLFATLLSGIGFFIIFIGFAVATFAGGIIAEAVRWGVQKRRSRYLSRVVIACLIVACSPFVLFSLFAGNIFGLIPLGLLIFVGGGAILARLR